jgi:gamma-glutamyl hydrolase
LNRVVFPGGAAAFSKSKGYSKAGKIIYDHAVELNGKVVLLKIQKISLIINLHKFQGTYFPLWGTCLGFQLLSFLSADMAAHRVRCSSQSQSLPLEFKSDFKTSKMFKYAPQTIIDVLTEKDVTPNFHSYCLTDAVLSRTGLDKEWRSISLNKDSNDFEFISSMEHRKYPFYGVQFHPEKNMFEWVKNKNIAHTANAVLQAQYFTNFFVKEAKKNYNHFRSAEDEEIHLIYNFPITYTALTGSAFQECYLFKKNVNYVRPFHGPVIYGSLFLNLHNFNLIITISFRT